MSTSNAEVLVAEPTGASEVAQLRASCEELELLLGRSVARIERLERDLDNARTQVAWLHRQLFGSKAERIAPEALQQAWLGFRNDQELKAKAAQPTRTARDLALNPPSYQLLFEPAAELDLSRTPTDAGGGSVAGATSASDGPGAVLGNSGAADDPNVSSKVAETAADALPASDSRSSETPAQAVPVAPTGDPAGEPSAPPKNNPKRKGHGRKRIPEHLPTLTVRLEPEESETPGARRIGADVSYRLGLRRAEIVRIAVIRERFAIDNEDRTESQIVTAPPPEEMIPRGLFAPSGLGNIIAGKWDFHLPWNRLARFWSVEGYRIPVSTLSGVAIRAEPLARELVREMETHARSVAPYLAIDATTARILRAKGDTRGYGWVRYIEQVCVLFNFTAKHNAKAAGELLDGWTCPTVADGASVFDAKHKETGNHRGGCWSHGRRKLVYAAPTDGRALVGVKLINDLFENEAKLLKLEHDSRLRERQVHSQPVIDQLFRWRDELLKDPGLGAGSSLAKSLRYMVRQQSRLTYFLQDGRVPIHNNLSELQIRHFATGRKNWLVLGSDPAAEASSTWLSLILSAKMHRLDPTEYLRDLFRVLPAWPRPRLIELAPHRWRETRLRLRPQELVRELGPITIPTAIIV